MTAVKPAIPGTVITWRGSTTPRIPVTAAETVALNITHDWGPVGSDSPGTDGRSGGLQLVQSFAEFTALYGDSDTAGRTAVAGAFAGEGLPGSAGAGAVLVNRMVGTGAVAATHTFKETGGTVDAFTITAKFKGARGLNISAALDDDPAATSTRTRLRIYYSGAVRESYVFDDTDVAGLVAQVNAKSQLVTAENKESTPTAVVNVTTPVALTGGANGAAPDATAHDDARTALEFQPFSVLSVAALTDSAIIASYVSWVQAQEDANRPIRLVVGGGDADTLSTALARSTACDDPHVINVGIGMFHDDLLDQDLNTAEIAPRIAGILAAKGEEHALTFSKLGGLHTVGATGAASDEIAQAIAGGVVTFMRVSSSDADLRIAKGVTTFTDTNDGDRPLDVFSDARLVGVMDNYVRSMKEWGDDVVIGDLPVNEDTRGLVLGHARELQDDLLRRGLILPGDDVTVPKPFVNVEDPGDPMLADAIPYAFGWQFAQTASYILGEGQIR